LHHAPHAHPDEGNVRARLRGDVDAYGRSPRHRAAQGIVDRGAEHGRGPRLRGVGLDVHPELVQDVARVREHVHHVRHRRALIAADVGHARLQQRLGDREYSLAVEGVAVPELELGDFGLERALHTTSSPYCNRPGSQVATPGTRNTSASSARLIKMYGTTARNMCVMV